MDKIGAGFREYQFRTMPHVIGAGGRTVPLAHPQHPELNACMPRGRAECSPGTVQYYVVRWGRVFSGHSTVLVRWDRVFSGYSTVLVRCLVYRDPYMYPESRARWGGGQACRQGTHACALVSPCPLATLCGDGCERACVCAPWVCWLGDRDRAMFEA